MKPKYFAISDDDCDYYSNKQTLINELKRGLFGDEDVIVYDLSDVEDVQELSSEDILFIYKVNNKKIIMKEDLEGSYFTDLDILKAEEEIKNGGYEVFDSVDDMFKELGLI